VLDPEALAQHGIESPADLQDLPEEEAEAIAEDVMDGMEVDIASHMEAYAQLLHAGFVRFQPDLQLDEVRGILTPKTVAYVPFQQIVQRVAVAEDEQMPQASGKAQASAPTN
jgi:hypothetical protein